MLGTAIAFYRNSGNKGEFFLLCDINLFIKTFRASMLLIFLFAITAFGGQADGDTVVAGGDGFSLTQKQIDEYRSAMTQDAGPVDRKGLLEAILGYELLGREYSEKQKEKGGVPPEGSDSIEGKVLASKKYIQQILNDYSLPEDVIESYYRSYPEKFKIGNMPGGGMSVLPLDDNLKNEIKFMIVEKSKNKIIEETVRNLMTKYKIRIINEYQ